MIQALLSGLLAGGGYALIAACVVFMFAMVRVLNFAQAAIGAFGAYVAIVLYDHGWAYLPAAGVGALAGAGLAFVCGAAMASWFADSPTEQRSTVSIALLVALLSLGPRIFGHEVRQVPTLLQGSSVHLFGVYITAASLVTLGFAIVFAVAVWLFLSRTLSGTRVRAMAERPYTAELAGVPARWIAIGLWAICGGIASVGVLVIAPTRSSDFGSLSLIILPALAAASLGLFRRMSGAIVGGVAIGALQGLAEHYSSTAPYADAVPLVVIAAVLIWSQRREVWDVAR